MSGIPRTLPSRTSTGQIAAKDVFRIALESLSAMDQTRRKAANLVWEKIENEQCSHFLGFHKHKRWQSRRMAEEHSQAMRVAMNIGWGDYETCEKLRDFARFLLELNPDAMMTISTEDFRALT